MKKLSLPFLCLMALHSPDNSSLFIKSSQVVAFRPLKEKHHDHIQKRANTVIYTGAGVSNFAIIETADQVVKMIAGCEK
jgi:hypothetical protein